MRSVPCALVCGHVCGTGATGGDDGVLKISGIRGQLVREEDLLGHITPYLVRLSLCLSL